VPHVLLRAYALDPPTGPGTVIDEVGHTDPALALRVYRQAMRRDQPERARLSALVEGADWANMGHRDAKAATAGAASAPKSADLQALRP
jgi:hypothetical protein